MRRAVPLGVAVLTLTLAACQDVAETVAPPDPSAVRIFIPGVKSFFPTGAACPGALMGSCAATGPRQVSFSGRPRTALRCRGCRRAPTAGETI